MGGVFSSPKVEVPVETSAADTARATEEERKKALDRQRRGMESTIKTSYRGQLDTKDLTRKKLLGE